MAENRLKKGAQPTTIQTPEAISDLAIAFSQVKNKIYKQPNHASQLREFLLNHNREQCNALYATEKHFRLLPFQEPHPIWELLLDLIAGGEEISPRQWTSAILLQVPPSGGKSATALKLTAHLAAIENHEETESVLWPLALPLLLTGADCQKHSLVECIANIFGYKNTYFSSPAALVKWLDQELLPNTDPHKNLTLILDDPWPETVRASWDELAEIIQAASKTPRIKIILFSSRLPYNFGQDFIDCLHHPAVQPGAFAAAVKPQYLGLPSFSPLAIKQLTDIKSQDKTTDMRAMSSWRVLTPPWAIFLYKFYEEFFGQKPDVFLASPFTLITTFYEHLVEKDPDLAAAIILLEENLGLKLLEYFEPPEELLPACNLLKNNNLLIKSLRGWRFCVREMATGLLVLNNYYGPGLAKWQLYCLAARRSLTRIFVESFIHDILQGHDDLIETILQISSELAEQDFQPLISNSIIYCLISKAKERDLTKTANFLYKTAEAALEKQQTTLASSFLLLCETLCKDEHSLELNCLKFKVRAMLAMLMIQRDSQEQAFLLLSDCQKELHELAPEIQQTPEMELSRLLLATSRLALNYPGVSLDSGKLAEFATLGQKALEHHLPTAFIEKFFTKLALFYEKEGAVPEAVTTWQTLQQVANISAKTGLLCRLSLLNLNAQEIDQEFLTAAKHAHEQLVKMVYRAGPLDSSLLPLIIIDKLLQIKILNFTEINTAVLKKRLQAELNGENVYNCSSIPFAIAENSLGLWFKNHGGGQFAKYFFINAIANYGQYLREWQESRIHQKNVSVFFYNLGFLYSKSNDFSHAGSAYSQTYRWRQLLISAYPNETEYRHDLALCNNVLGVLTYNCGRYKDSIKYYNESYHLLTNLKNNPKYKQLLHDLAVVLQNRAVSQQEEGQTTEAVSSFMEALDCLNQSLLSAREKAESKNRLAIALSSCGIKIHGIGKSREGFSANKIALEIAEELHQAYPEDPVMLASMCIIKCSTAGIGRQIGHYPEARKAENEAIATLTERIKIQPHEPGLRLGLANVYLTMSRTSQQQSGRNSPKELCRKARQILEFLLTEFPDDQQAAQTLAECQQLAITYGEQYSA